MFGLKVLLCLSHADCKNLTFSSETVHPRRARPCAAEHPPHAHLYQFCFLPARVSVTLSWAEHASILGIRFCLLKRSHVSWWFHIAELPLNFWSSSAASHVLAWQACTVMPGFHGAGDWAQGFVHAVCNTLPAQHLYCFDLIHLNVTASIGFFLSL